MTRGWPASTLLAPALALLAACGSGLAPDTRPRGPLPASENLDGSYRARLFYYQGPSCAPGSSIAATGPGPDPAFTATTVQLSCSGGTWSGAIAFASGHPPGQTPYLFTVSEGGATRQETGTIPCWLEDLPSPIDPDGADTVSSPVTFRWSRPGTLAAAGHEFAVYVSVEPMVRASAVDAPSLSLALPPRWYAGWAVEAIGVGGHEPASPLRCSARNTSGAPFVVAP